MKREVSATSSRRSAGSRPRILAGRWKGRSLQVPRDARPTSGRAREALFDVLQDSIPESRVLDLFAGSGAVGLEALSRGASATVFVEKDSRALERNLATLGAHRGEFEVVREDVRAAAGALARRGDRFDLVFADPPYALKTALVRPIASLLAPGGRLVVQTDSEAAPPELPGLALEKRRAYGRNVFWFFERARLEPLPPSRPGW
jgi:16S rRNA (guanine(966)-N(2))-methyltransferase RsmD